MKSKIVTAAALRVLANKILEIVKNAEAPDEPYIIDFDKIFEEIKNVG